MKKNKVAMLMAMLLVLSLLLCACGQKTQPQTDAQPAQTTTENTQTAATPADETADETAEKNGYSVTFVLNNRDEFTNTLAEGMERKAEELDVNLSMQDAQNDTSRIIQFVETAKNAGEDAVVVFPIDSETIPTIIETAGDMPIVFVNRAPNDLTYLSGKSAYVGSEETEAGYFQGEYLAEYFKAQGVEVVKPIMLLEPIGAENTVKRTESVKQALVDAGLTVEVVVELGCEWDRMTAINKFRPCSTRQTITASSPTATRWPAAR